MTIAYVNAGTLASGNALTSITPALPASITAGNLLLAVVDKANLNAITLPAGWTLISDNQNATFRGICAYKIATGSDVAQAFTWTGSTTDVVACIYQYSGVVGIGNTQKNSGSTNPHTCPAITTSQPNSMAVYIDTSNDAATNLGNPSGWVDDNSVRASTGGIDVGHKSIATSGTSTGSISANGGASWYLMFNIELLSVAPIDAPATSSGSASTSTLAGYGIASPAESTGALTSTSSYIFAIGCFITSTVDATTLADRKYIGSGIGLSSSQISAEASIVWHANLIVTAIAAVSGAIVGERITNSIASSAATIADNAKGNFNLNLNAASTGEFTSSASVLRAIAAAASASAALSSVAAVKAQYYLLVQSIANVIDGVQFINEYWDGWAYNLNNEAPSFYEQYKFNSFAKLGQNYYGLNDSGIHLLSGSNDNGSQIHSLIKTGQSDYDDASLKTIPTIYAGARSPQEIILTASVDSNPDYDYIFIGTPTELAPVRVKLGRGLKGRYWQLEVRNKNGAYIEIDQLDIPSVSTSRKV